MSDQQHSKKCFHNKNAVSPRKRLVFYISAFGCTGSYQHVDLHFSPQMFIYRAGKGTYINTSSNASDAIQHTEFRLAPSWKVSAGAHGSYD